MKQTEEVQKKNLADNHIARQERNRVVVTGMSIMNIILAIAYYIEVLKGERQISSYMIVFLLTTIPTVLMIAMFLKDREAKNLRYIAAGFYIVFYAYVMFTADKLIVFCYILALMTLMNTYGDIRLSVACCCCGLVIAVIKVISLLISGTVTAAVLTEIEIMIACLLLVLLYSFMSTRLVNQIGKSRLDSLDMEKQQASDLLGTVLEVAEAIGRITLVLMEETGKLDESVSNTKESMENLAEGASRTAESIQTQQEKTAEIQDHIMTLEEVTGQIVNHVNTSEKIVENSQQTMDQLMEQVGKSEQSSNRVAAQMAELKTYTDQMQNIMTLINNVASQTELLALNASIEAARAGEAGRGFGVVATEISGLANQTSDATGDINVLIASIEHSLAEVVKAVNGMLESNQIQTKYVNDTASEFSQIHDAISQIFRESNRLSEIVDTVSKANQMIVETIENVSASTEEITAKAAETLEGSNKDKESVDNVLVTLEDLKGYARELNKNR